jgi:riboflavin synthase
MFAGIIETTAEVKSLKKTRGILRLALNTKKAWRDLTKGQSLSINGTCLTLVQKRKNVLSFDVIPETLKITTFLKLKVGDIVNLERSLRYGASIDGHLVLGHVEAKGHLLSIHRGLAGCKMRIKTPQRLLRRIQHKGCVALDGISLTVSKVTKSYFEVSLIPHTLKCTNLKYKKSGDDLNLETDFYRRTRF